MALHDEIIKNPITIKGFFDLYGVIPDLSDQNYLDILSEITDESVIFVDKLVRASLFSDALEVTSGKKDKFKKKHTKKGKPEKEYRDKLLELSGTTDTVEKFLEDLDT